MQTIEELRKQFEGVVADWEKFRDELDVAARTMLSDGVSKELYDQCEIEAHRLEAHIRQAHNDIAVLATLLQHAENQEARRVNDENQRRHYENCQRELALLERIAARLEENDAIPNL